MGGTWILDLSLPEHIQRVYDKEGLQGLSTLAFMLEVVIRDIQEVDSEHWKLWNKCDELDKQIAKWMLDAVPENVQKSMAAAGFDDLYDIANYITYHGEE